MAQLQEKKRVILRRSNFKSGRRDDVAKVYCGVTLINDHRYSCAIFIFPPTRSTIVKLHSVDLKC